MTGGKYTTYRVMAADAVDAAVKELAEPVPPSRTQFVPLAGAGGFRELWAEREAIAAKTGLDVATVAHLLRRHGSLAYEVLDLVEAEPELGRARAPGRAVPGRRGGARGDARGRPAPGRRPGAPDPARAGDP